MEIKAIGGVGMGQGLLSSVKGQAPVSGVAGAGKFFQELVSKVNDMSLQSDQMIQKLATGENRNLHETMIAVEKASISFQFMSQIRNKALDAYQEVMRMPV